MSLHLTLVHFLCMKVSNIKVVSPPSSLCSPLHDGLSDPIALVYNGFWIDLWTGDCVFRSTRVGLLLLQTIPFGSLAQVNSSIWIGRCGEDEYH